MASQYVQVAAVKCEGCGREEQGPMPIYGMLCGELRYTADDWIPVEEFRKRRYWCKECHAGPLLVSFTYRDEASSME